MPLQSWSSLSPHLTWLPATCDRVGVFPWTHFHLVSRTTYSPGHPLPLKTYTGSSSSPRHGACRSFLSFLVELKHTEFITQLKTVMHVCNPSTWEMEAGGLWVWGQPELHTKTLSQKTKGWEWSSVVECLFNVGKALDSIPAQNKGKKRIYYSWSWNALLSDIHMACLYFLLALFKGPLLQGTSGSHL
jgi:hypothetical protein